MQSENTILTIDVGSVNLKMAQFAFQPNGQVVMTAFDIRKMEVEQVENSGEEQEVVAFIKTYNEMIAANDFSAKQVHLSLSSKLSFQRLSKLPAVTSNRSAIDKVVEYEARQTVPYAINDVEWGYQLIRHQWEEKHQETAEDGTVTEVTEPKEEFESMFVAIKTDRITAYTDVIQDSGKIITSVEISPITLFNAALACQVREGECTMLLNIGGSSSCLMIADNNRAFIRTIPIAGDTITNQIAKEFNIPVADAEQMKQRYGFVALGGAYEEPDSELAATISKIARNVMTRLHGEVSRSVNVWRAQHGGSAPVRLLLSGGGSTMLYMTDFFQEKLRVPVDYLNTFSSITIGPGVDKEKVQLYAPMVQELIGMTMSGANCPINISLLPRTIRNQFELDHKKPFFYASAAILISCLVLFGFAVSRLLVREKARASRVQEKVEKITQKATEIDKMIGSLNATRGQYEEYTKLLAQRNSFFDVINELETLIPDMMWLSKIEYYDVMPPKPKKIVVAENQQGSGGEENQTSSNLAYKDMREIKFILVEGYTLAVSNDKFPQNWVPGKLRVSDNWLRVFRNRLTKSKYFKDEGKLYTTREYDNLNSFTIVLELKEPIRK